MEKIGGCMYFFLAKQLEFLHTKKRLISQCNDMCGVQYIFTYEGSTRFKTKNTELRKMREKI